MTHPDGTLTTHQPGQPPTTRPVPPSWATVAPLLDQYKIALLPRTDGRWDVHTGSPVRSRIDASVRTGPFAALPQAIQELAAQCAAAAGEEEA